MSSRRCGKMTRTVRLTSFHGVEKEEESNHRYWEKKDTQKKTNHTSVAQCIGMKLPGWEHTSLRISKTCHTAQRTFKLLLPSLFSRSWTAFHGEKNTGMKEFGTIDKDCGKMWTDKPASVLEGQMEREKWDRQWGIRARTRSGNCRLGHAKLCSAEMQASVSN